MALLAALYVMPDFWNEGVGTALLDQFEQFSLDHKRMEIEFRVLSENDIGMNFYQKHGYQVVEQRETDRFGQTVTESVFRGTLD